MANPSDVLQAIKNNPLYQSYFSNIPAELFLAQFKYESPSLCYNCTNSSGFYGFGVNQQELNQAYREGYIQNPEPTLNNIISTVFDRYLHYTKEGKCQPTDAQCLMTVYNGNPSYFDNVMKIYAQYNGGVISTLPGESIENSVKNTTEAVINAPKTILDWIENEAINIVLIILAIVLIIIAGFTGAKEIGLV